MIVLLGATGYTGKLVAAELARRRLPHRLGGRDPAKLARFPAVEGRETFVVDVGEPSRLDQLLDGADALITTVGPFGRLGMPVVEAAARNGVAYVDSSGETDFLADVYAKFADAPVPIVPAGGFDFVPGDLLAAVAAGAGAGGTVNTVNEVAVTYDNGFIVPSRGTLRSTVDILASLEVAPRQRRVAFPEGTKVAVEVPWGERLTVPRHIRGARVVTSLVVGPVAAPLFERWAAPVVKRAGPVIAAVVDRVPEGPPDPIRRLARFRILAECIGPGGRRAAIGEGRDVYGLTARFLVELAQRASGAGACTPAQAVEPVPFLDAVSYEDELGSFTWRLVD